MKRNILFVAMLLFVAASIEAQVIVKHGDSSERVELGGNMLVKMVFDVYGENNGDNVHLILQSGDTLTFDIDEVSKMAFAADVTKIDEMKQSGEAAIVYDVTTHTACAVNAEEGVIRIFTSEGRLVKKVAGTTVSVADLNDGLYIVSYNMELNAKIVKK